MPAWLGTRIGKIRQCNQERTNFQQDPLQQINCRSFKQTSQNTSWRYLSVFLRELIAITCFPGGGGGVLPYKALMGTCGQPGYIFRDFCLEQGIEFIIFVLIRVTIYQFLS